MCCMERTHDSDPTPTIVSSFPTLAKWIRTTPTPGDSGRLRTTPNDSERLRTIPDDSDSGRLRVTPYDSGRFGTTPDIAARTYLPESIPNLSESDRSRLRIFGLSFHSCRGILHVTFPITSMILIVVQLLGHVPLAASNRAAELCSCPVLCSTTGTLHSSRALVSSIQTNLS